MPSEQKEAFKTKVSFESCEDTAIVKSPAVPDASGKLFERAVLT